MKYAYKSIPNQYKAHEICERALERDPNTLNLLLISVGPRRYLKKTSP